MIEISEGQYAYFASDLHLSEKTPDTLTAFTRWLASVARADNLIFLLGDLFEVWLGDDHSDAVSIEVSKAIYNAKLTGARVFFMHGNRDFLLGEQFAETSGMEILEDPDFIRVGNQIILISHGDQLCTDDKAYQKFRLQSRDEAWKEGFLSRPIEERMAIAGSIRDESKRHKSSSALNIMDTNSDAVENAFKGKWPDGCLIGRSQVIIHGHTHRCAVHGPETTPLHAAGQSCSGQLENHTRIVLPDWNYDAIENTSQKGGYLQLTSDGQYTLTVFN